MSASASNDEWMTVDVTLSASLTDARLQLHHAAQLVAAMGISFLPKTDDDSHTNMQWVSGALASRLVGPRAFRLGVRPHPLALVVIVDDAELASFPLNGKTISGAADWVRMQCSALGLDGSRYTLVKHYTIPSHAVDTGAPFDTGAPRPFDELGRWYSNAALALEHVASAHDGSAVRCWPHHFDIATLITAGPGRTIGVGLEPGDDSYAEPYWYVNMYPAPAAGDLPPVEGGGAWHMSGWFGAVLPASRLASGSAQREQVDAFLTTAVAAARELHRATA